MYPVSSTVDILKNQFILVSIAALAFAFILAFLYSRRISRPIKAMTESARKLGAGNYNVTFTAHSYSEVNELADTLAKKTGAGAIVTGKRISSPTYPTILRLPSL